MPDPSGRLRVCFVTGTRAEFGLMEPVLHAIRRRKRLCLQLLVTGMHLEATHGRTIDAIRDAGWHIDAVVPWRGAPCDDAPAPHANPQRDGTIAQRDLAISTGGAMAVMARALSDLASDVVLIVGDRVEAFAGAAAGHLLAKAVAHVHGGDRALGQVDDALRHAITKLSHLHFPATDASARRIEKLGEQPWRITRAGSPALDGIQRLAMPAAALRKLIPVAQPRKFALLAYHPASADAAAERRTLRRIASQIYTVGIESIIAIYPNNDPGSSGVIEAIEQLAGSRGADQFVAYQNLARPAYLGLLRDAALLIGNSSSGIIEAASFGAPAIDIGTRQQGRESGKNVEHVNSAGGAALRRTLSEIWRDGAPRRYPSRNLYGDGAAARRIADRLATLTLDERLLHKLIAY